MFEILTKKSFVPVQKSEPSFRLGLCLPMCRDIVALVTEACASSYLVLSVFLIEVRHVQRLVKYTDWVMFFTAYGILAILT